MKGIFIIWFCLLFQTCFAQDDYLPTSDSITHRIVLIGDAGDPGSIAHGKSAVIDAVRRTVQLDNKTLVLYMGDNIYVNGLPCEGDVCYIGAINVLDSQAALVKGTPAQGIFMPGNHDWANGKPEGYDNILRQAAYVNQIADNIKFYPEDGCPGPVEIPLGPDVVLVIMDSEWWILKGNNRPGLESDCANKTEEEVLDDLKDILNRNNHKLVLFTCHHTFKSSGVHSGYFNVKQHIFPFTDLNKNLYIPLPVIGSIYPISRSVFGGPQDLKFPAYANMINKVDGVLKTYPYVIHMAGHEHNLQLINDSNYHYVVSGGGCKSQRVFRNKRTKFVSGTMGFAVMDISGNKNVHVSFYTLDAKTDKIKKAYSDNILNFSKFPEIAKDTVTVHNTVYKDYVVAPINKDYDKASAFKRLLFGDNYRKEWATPVKFKVFDINSVHGGFKIERMSGGNQSKSLRLTDKNGVKWVLRSANKNPEKVIPVNFRNTFASGIVQDMISAANPYGALCVPPLAEALDIIHPTPEYYFVPDDYSLGMYRTSFANTVCELEKSAPTRYGEKDKNTFSMFNKLRENNHYKVDEHAMLKARALDFLIADYDRHYDQWKWGLVDTGKQKIFYPIPHDRDQALFYSDGLVMDYLTWRRLPFLKGFKRNFTRVKWQGYVARYFDRQYLNEIDEQQWKNTMREFKADLTDDVIAESINQLPPEIRAIDSSTISVNLKSRRDQLPKKSLLYYRFLAKRVDILGSNEDEYFDIRPFEKTGLSVNVYAINKKGDTNLVMYSRNFNEGATKELRLYGFNGNDHFRIDDNAKSRIKVIMVGGGGQDTFDIHGSVRNALYDFTKEDNKILSSNRTRNMMSKDPLVNNYNEKEDNYTWVRFPHLQMGYNSEDQFLLGVGLYLKTYNFRKRPYSSDQRFTTLFSIANSAYQVRYRGDFRNVVGKTGIGLEGEYVNLTLNNFFGFGNDTKKSPDADLLYYRVRYTDLAGSALLTRSYFNNLVNIGFGPSYYYYHFNTTYNSNPERIISNPENLGLDSASIYPDKSYLGGKFVINMNNLNSELFPTRGVEWNTYLLSMQGLNASSKPITKLESNMSVYASLASLTKLVAVLRFGGGHIFSQNFEYFQAFTLGQNNYLRGFRKDRFSGSSMAYADIELRIKLFDIKSYICPGALGIIGFNDLGRVWMENEVSHTWHDAYGAGIYYAPFNVVALTITTAFSGEESLFNFTVGSKINLTF